MYGVWILIFCLLLACWIPALGDAAERTSGTGFYFDTVVTITLYGAPEGLMERLMAECGRYEQLLSKTIEDSDVDRINHAHGEPVQVAAETYAILQRAKEISALTGGDFSVTIAPLTAMWDFTGGTERMPTEEERLAALPLVDDGKLQLGEDMTVSLPEGMQIDLGGIAKGYIADSLADICREAGTPALLNFGGNVYAVLEKPDGSPWRVGVRDPQHPNDGSTLYIISVKDQTVVTSGTYERYFDRDGVRYHHILDPRTGSSAVTDLTSVTIVTDSSMDADALATACIVRGFEGSMALLEELELPALLVDQDNHMYGTKAFMALYHQN